MTNNNIEESIKKRLAEIFQKNSTIEKAILFGSRARDNHKKTSDIDIADRIVRFFCFKHILEKVYKCLLK